MIDQLAGRWRSLIDRREEMIRLGRESEARGIETEVARVRSRMARLFCRRPSASGAGGIGARPDRRQAYAALASL
jgi:hypothetical protein